jgi:magnesium transporter
MLTSYRLANGSLKAAVIAEGAAIPQDSLWLDLYAPTDAERAAVGKLLGLDMPTRADMVEIEVSSRLYKSDDALYMTALMLAAAETDQPVADVVTFVLAKKTLVTIRYIDPQPFRTFHARCERGTAPGTSAEAILLGLIDVIVDRVADILERIGGDVEQLSRKIFNAKSSQTQTSQDLQEVLRLLGRTNDLTGKMRESLLTIQRLLSFLTSAIEGSASKDVRVHIKTLTRDVQSLQDHSNYLSGKLSYVLDATLGLINIEQNNIIKVLTIVSVVGVPPTLIASMYGMNFKTMPEYDWAWGYPYGLALIALSAIVPLLWFKLRGWL